LAGWVFDDGITSLAMTKFKKFIAKLIEGVANFLPIVAVSKSQVLRGIASGQFLYFTAKPKDWSCHTIGDGEKIVNDDWKQEHHTRCPKESLFQAASSGFRNRFPRVGQGLRNDQRHQEIEAAGQAVESDSP
jgi:hypothetical protein